jgi:CRISPR-associated protein Cas5d
MRNTVDIKVWGDYACFTRPEFKVERVSYPVMTPSAARGILEAIYWKPQIRYRIQRIGILRHPRSGEHDSALGTQWSLLRNEISRRQSDQTDCLTADDQQQRQQRTSLVLKKVAYRIQAWIELRNGETNIGKHLDCFRRRAERGQYFHKPFLGCREFASDFEWLGHGKEGDESITPPDDLSLPIGTMLFDTAYIENPEHYRKNKQDRLEFWRHNHGLRVAEGHAKRLFFNAEIKNGWLVETDSKTLPVHLFEELKKLEAENGDY